MRVKEPSVNLCRHVVQMRRELISNPQLIDRFEQSPTAFFPEIEESNEADWAIRAAVLQSPPGVRFLTLDRCVALMRTGTDQEDPKIDPAIIPAVVGVTIAIVYNAAVIGNIGVYHQAVVNIGAALNAIAVRNTKYSGALDSPLPSASEKRQVPTPMSFSATYLGHSLHHYFVEHGVGESREKMLLRSALAAAEETGDNKSESVVHSSFRGVEFTLSVTRSNFPELITINDGTMS